MNLEINIGTVAANDRLIYHACTVNGLTCTTKRTVQINFCNIKPGIIDVNSLHITRSVIDTNARFRCSDLIIESCVISDLNLSECTNIVLRNSTIISAHVNGVANITLDNCIINGIIYLHKCNTVVFENTTVKKGSMMVNDSQCRIIMFNECNVYWVPSNGVHKSRVKYTFKNCTLVRASINVSRCEISKCYIDSCNVGHHRSVTYIVDSTAVKSSFTNVEMDTCSINNTSIAFSNSNVINSNCGNSHLYGDGRTTISLSNTDGSILRNIIELYSNRLQLTSVLNGIILFSALAYIIVRCIR